MSFFLQRREVLAQRTRHIAQVFLGVLELEIIGDKEGLDCQSRDIRCKQVGIIAGPDAGWKVGLQNRFAGRMLGVKLEQFDDLGPLINRKYRCTGKGPQGKGSLG